jgi:hypothetical protein
MESIALNDVATKIINFLRSINITVGFGEFPQEKEFLPGICLQKTGLLINTDKLIYPGDLLHEAGHIAVAPPAKRAGFDGALGSGTDEDAGEEMMAIAWSYAAAKHLGIDPRLVFHSDGYKGGGESIADNFAVGRFLGVSLLQWVGLTYEPRNAIEKNTAPYPHMIKWLRE